MQRRGRQSAAVATGSVPPATGSADAPRAGKGQLEPGFTDARDLHAAAAARRVDELAPAGINAHVGLRQAEEDEVAGRE
jgi:hypothetical protein